MLDHLLAGRQELLHRADERSAVSVQLEAALTGTEQLKQQPNSHGPPAILRGPDQSLTQSIDESTELQQRLHTVNLSAGRTTPTHLNLCCPAVRHSDGSAGSGLTFDL